MCSFPLTNKMAPTTSAVNSDSIVFTNSCITWLQFECFVELKSDVLQNVKGKDALQLSREWNYSSVLRVTLIKKKSYFSWRDVDVPVAFGFVVVFDGEVHGTNDT